jgi:hypothetical protein
MCLSLFCHFIEGDRTESWLSDLDADPTETANLAAKQAGALQRLRSGLQVWVKETVLMR